MDENSVWWAANSLMRLYGPKAAAEATAMADRLLVQKDSEGHALWLRISRAIHDLERRTADVRELGL